jgi:hypothetical protein
MLPDFPSLKSRRHERLINLAQDISQHNHPILPELARRTQHEGEGVLMNDIDNDVAMSEYELFQAEFTIRADELPGLTNDKWVTKLRELTDHFASEQMKLLLRRVEESTQKTGNVIKSSEADISVDAILDMLERVTLDFEGNDLSPGYSFLTSPEQGKRLAQLEPTPEQEERHKAILARQRIEWRLREANRKLVD